MCTTLQVLDKLNNMYQYHVTLDQLLGYCNYNSTVNYNHQSKYTRNLMLEYYNSVAEDWDVLIQLITSNHRFRLQYCTFEIIHTLFSKTLHGEYNLSNTQLIQVVLFMGYLHTHTYRWTLKYYLSK
jgi:hypothetical protein